METPIFESERLIFKPLSLDHLSVNYVNWLNDSQVNRFLDSGGDYTMKKLKDFLSDIEKKNILFWAIHIKDTDKHIGNIKVDPVSFKNGLGEYGIMLGCKSEWGKGFAKESTLRILDFCFSEIGLRKITLGVVEDNTSALKLYEKLGFIVEGIYKKHGLYRDKYCNIIRMAIFNSEFNLHE